jgi:hypothetical protein
MGADDEGTPRELMQAPQDPRPDRLFHFGSAIIAVAHHEMAFTSDWL